MKTIKRLNDKVTHYDERAEQKDIDVLPTFRRMFLNQVGKSLASNPEEAIDLYQLGLKLRIDGEQADIEDAEFKLLKKAMERNQAMLMSHFQAQGLLLLKECENT